jgi:hypothetical protein
MGKLEGEVTLALRHDAIAGEPLSSRIEQTAAMANPDRPVDLYSGWFTWAGFGAEVKGYFHTGHADWEAEGDFFNFLPECYDFDSYDKWGAKLPIAVEGAYHFGLPGAQGLKIIGGPIIYSGASPMVLGKWYQTINAAKSLLSFSALLSQEIASYSTETGTVETPRSKASLWLAWQPEMRGVSSLRADVGILESNWQKLDDTWRVDASGEHTIGFADTLAVKGRVSYSPIQYLSAQAEAVYAGLVAESNGGTARVGTLLTDSGAGNRVEIKGGITGNYDVFQLQLNALWRQPLTGPIEDAALVSLAQTNPFYVGASREALRLEAVLSWDMEPGTWIWAWDGDDTEGALAAASLVANYSVYEGATDPGSYKGNDGKRYWYALGLPRIEGAYSVALRTVFNPLPDLRIVNVAQFVRGQPNGGVFSDERPTVSGFQEALKVRYKQALFSGMVAMDMWGPESFQKDLNLTYPLRWSFELGWSFKARPSLVNNSDRIALRWNGVVRDHFSYNFNARDSEELVLYFNIGF